MHLDDLSLHDLQVFVGDLQRQVTMSDGSTTEEVCFHLEGEELKDYRRKLWCIEQHLARYEIMRVKDEGRRRR